MGGPEGLEQIQLTREPWPFKKKRKSKKSSTFYLGGWARRSQAHLRQFDARQFVALTLYAVRGYDALLIIFSMSSQLSTASGSALSKPFNIS